MRDPSQTKLSRRERQLLDILYQRGKASAVELTEALPDAPTSTTVRGLLRILEQKGHIVHEEDGLRYVYRPAIPKREAGAKTMAHVVRTFFEGSPSRAMAALLGSQGKLSEEELDAIEAAIRKARGGKK